MDYSVGTTSPQHAIDWKLYILKNDFHSQNEMGPSPVLPYIICNGMSERGDIVLGCQYLKFFIYKNIQLLNFPCSVCVFLHSEREMFSACQMSFIFIKVVSK